MSPTAPAPDPAQVFESILDGLCQAAAARMVKYPFLKPLLMLLWTRLRRTIARFHRLAARVRAGRLPPARPAAPRDAGRRRPAKTPRLPAGFGWACLLLPSEAACRGSQLRHLLEQPDMAALLDAAPQAKRLLRPLCRMLAVAPPAILAPTPRPPAAPPAAPAPPPASLRRPDRPANPPDPPLRAPWPASPRAPPTG